MLIIVEHSPEGLEAENKDELADFYAELVRASFRSIHLVVCSRDTCKWVSENLQISEREKAHLNHIREKFTEYGALKKSAYSSLTILLGSQPISETEPKHFSIGHMSLLDSDYLDPAQLLVENNNTDGKLYEIILQQTKVSEKIKNLKITPLNGGGSGITNCFETALDEKRITVCLLDSDKRSPYDEQSGTQTEVERIAKGRNFIGDVFISIGREAENHIPLSIFEDHKIKPKYSGYNEIKNLLAEQSKTNSHDCLWLYFSVKNGFGNKEKDIPGKETNAYHWVVSKYANDGSDIEAKKIPGFGRDTLNKFLGCKPAIKSFKDVVKSKEWQRTFGNFFANLYWFFVAEKRRATS